MQALLKLARQKQIHNPISCVLVFSQEIVGTHKVRVQNLLTG